MERYDAENRFHAWYEHWHRYHWLAPLIKDQVVADLACGEGYGSALLAQHAKEIFAIDIDQTTIDAASRNYPVSHLKFLQADVLETPLEQNSLDVVVSFETLEHLVEQQQLLDEFNRILKPQGVLVLSTPDKNVYSGEHHHNEFHEKELSADEFTALVEKNFTHVHYFGQELQTVSLLSPMNTNSGLQQTKPVYVDQDNAFKPHAKLSKPTYMIAVASHNESALLPFQQLGASYFNDVNNSLFQHYEKQVADFLSTDQQLIEAKQQLVSLKNQVKQQSMVISQLQARLGL